MASLSVSVPPVMPWGEGGAQRGETADGEERGWRGQAADCVIFVLLRRGDLLGADQRRAAAALPPRVVGTAGVFVVGALALRDLVDGRQLVMMRIITVIILHI